MENITFENLPAAVTLLLQEVKAIRLSLQANTPEQTDQLLTVAQAAEYLSLAKSTVYSLISEGQLPNLKKGKRVYFQKNALLDYLKSGSRKSYSQLAEEARS